MGTKITYATKCGIPGCWEPHVEGGVLCEEHLRLGYLDDYLTYRAYRDDGYSHMQAAIWAGLADPPE